MAEPPTPTEATLFVHQLRRLTPRVWVTPLIIAINVALFAFLVARGADVVSPSTEALLAQGANYGPLTLAGAWWRLLTSTALHIGIIHLAMNMFVLAQIGPLVERMVGNLPFLLLYLVTGFLASIASLAWDPQVVSAGASGAIFGCYGLFIGMLLRNQAAIPPSVRGQMFKGVATFLVLNVVVGVSMTQLDQAAHVGGLVAGVLAGLVVALPLDPVGPRLRRALLVAVVGGALGVGVLMTRPVPMDWHAPLDATVQLENRINAQLEAATRQSQAGELTDAQFAVMLRTDILPAWQAQRDVLAQTPDVPDRIQATFDKLVRYMDLRGKGLVLLAEAAETGDMSKLEAAKAAFKEAEAQAGP